MIIRQLNYEPYKFAPPAPPLLNPTDYPLPWHDHILRTREIQEEDRRFRARYEEDLKRPKGFFGKLDTSVQRQKHKVEKRHDKNEVGSDQKDHKKALEQSLKNFRRYFRYPPTEQLWAEVDCLAIHTRGEMKVSLFVSTNYVSIVHESKKMRQSLYISIPLKHIVSIQHAQVVTKFGSVPMIQRLFDPTSKFNAIQLYAEDGNIHLFYHFDQMKAKCLFNILDKCWRASFMNQGTYAPQFPGEPPKSPYDAIFRGNYPEDEIDEEQQLIVGYPGQYGVLQVYGIPPSIQDLERQQNGQSIFQEPPSFHEQHAQYSNQNINRLSIEVDSPMQVHIKQKGLKSNRSQSVSTTCSSRSSRSSSRSRMPRKQTMNQQPQQSFQQQTIINEPVYVQDQKYLEDQKAYIEDDSSNSPTMMRQRLSAMTTPSHSTRMILGSNNTPVQFTQQDPIICNDQCNTKGFCTNQECVNTGKCCMNQSQQEEQCCTNTQCNNQECGCTSQNCLNNPQCKCTSNCNCKFQTLNDPMQREMQEQHQYEEPLAEKPLTTVFIPTQKKFEVPLQRQNPVSQPPPMHMKAPPMLTQQQPPKQKPFTVPLQKQRPLTTPPHLNLQTPQAQQIIAPTQSSTTTRPITLKTVPVTTINSQPQQVYSKQSSFYNPSNERPIVYEPNTANSASYYNQPQRQEQWVANNPSRSQSTSRSTSQQGSPLIRNKQQIQSQSRSQSQSSYPQQQQQQFFQPQQQQQQQQSYAQQPYVSSQPYQQERLIEVLQSTEQDNQQQQQEDQKEKRGSYEFKKEDLPRNEDKFSLRDYQELQSHRTSTPTTTPESQTPTPTGNQTGNQTGNYATPSNPTASTATSSNSNSSNARSTSGNVGSYVPASHSHSRSTSQSRVNEYQPKPQSRSTSQSRLNENQSRSQSHSRSTSQSRQNEYSSRQNEYSSRQNEYSSRQNEYPQASSYEYSTGQTPRTVYENELKATDSLPSQQSSQQQHYNDSQQQQHYNDRSTDSHPNLNQKEQKRRSFNVYTSQANLDDSVGFPSSNTNNQYEEN